MGAAALEGRQVLRAGRAAIDAVLESRGDSQAAADQAAALIASYLGGPPDPETFLVLAGSIVAALLSDHSATFNVLVTVKLLDMLDRAWFG